MKRLMEKEAYNGGYDIKVSSLGFGVVRIGRKDQKQEWQVLKGDGGGCDQVYAMTITSSNLEICSCIKYESLSVCATVTQL